MICRLMCFSVPARSAYDQILYFMTRPGVTITIPNKVSILPCPDIACFFLLFNVKYKHHVMQRIDYVM